MVVVFAWAVLLVVKVAPSEYQHLRTFVLRSSRAFYWTIGIEVTEIHDRLELRDWWKSRR
jgi:hypothetical protein